MKYKKIKEVIDNIIEPSIKFIKRSRNRKTMPFNEIEKIINIFFPKTKHYKREKGFYKNVFIIHSKKRKIVLKIGRSKRHVQKDYITYRSFCKRMGDERRANRYFAKIYWREGLFMLQKYGKKVKIPEKEINRLKKIGSRFGLKDIREANIMKVNNKFKIVDAERK